MKSQNGWSIVSGGQTDRTSFTGKTCVGGIRKGDAGIVLNYVGVQFNKRVEKLKSGWCWGWAAPKPIPGSSSYSNHASATAIDLNAPIHPWKKKGTFSAKQVKEIRKILAECGGVIRWGGDYSRVDEMHFEINANASRVKTVANKLKGVDMYKAKYEDMKKKYERADKLRADHKKISEARLKEVNKLKAQLGSADEANLLGKALLPVITKLGYKRSK